MSLSPPVESLGSPKKKYRRILLKISGEALMGKQNHGIDSKMLLRIVQDIKMIQESGIEICLVVGGGNIFRGINGEEQGIGRTTADYMGMLATVLNSLALQSMLEKVGLHTRVLSAIPIQSVCEPYIRRRAVHHMEKGRVVIFAAGTGNPYFTTDTAATLRASEMNCDILMKGTKVDGVYSEDPVQNPQAIFYESLTYSEVLTRNLKVMDAASVALARENNLPLLVFSIKDPEGLSKAIANVGKFTIISNNSVDHKESRNEG